MDNHHQQKNRTQIVAHSPLTLCSSLCPPPPPPQLYDCDGVVGPDTYMHVNLHEPTRCDTLMSNTPSFLTSLSPSRTPAVVATVLSPPPAHMPPDILAAYSTYTEWAAGSNTRGGCSPGGEAGGGDMGGPGVWGGLSGSAPPRKPTYHPLLAYEGVSGGRDGQHSAPGCGAGCSTGSSASALATAKQMRGVTKGHLERPSLTSRLNPCSAPGTPPPPPVEAVAVPRSSDLPYSSPLPAVAGSSSAAKPAATAPHSPLGAPGLALPSRPPCLVPAASFGARSSVQTSPQGQQHQQATAGLQGTQLTAKLASSPGQHGGRHGRHRGNRSSLDFHPFHPPPPLLPQQQQQARFSLDLDWSGLEAKVDEGEGDGEADGDSGQARGSTPSDSHDQVRDQVTPPQPPHPRALSAYSSSGGCSSAEADWCADAAVAPPFRNPSEPGVRAAVAGGGGGGAKGSLRDRMRMALQPAGYGHAEPEGPLRREDSKSFCLEFKDVGGVGG